MEPSSVIDAAYAVADAATGRLLAEAYQACGIAAATLVRVRDDPPADMVALSAALGRALAAWVHLQTCADLHFGVRRRR